MRTLIVSSIAVLLSACASQAPTKAEAAPAPAPVAAAAKPGPQCYSGDDSRFFDVGANASIAGVKVVCKATADGKAAQWMGEKH
jgi:hypothetical protein